MPTKNAPPITDPEHDIRVARLGPLLEAAKKRHELEISKNWERKNILGVIKDLVVNGRTQDIGFLIPQIEAALKDAD